MGDKSDKVVRRRERIFFDTARFRRKMVDLNISQADLAAESGIAQPNVSMLLSGRLAYIGPSRRDRLQAALRTLAERKAAAETTDGAEAPHAQPNIRPL